MNVDVDSALESLNCVNVGSVANISEVSGVSIFRVKVIIHLLLELYILHYILHQKKNPSGCSCSFHQKNNYFHQ